MSVYRRRWTWIDAQGKTREGKGWEAKIHVTGPDGVPVRLTKSFKFELDAKSFERLTLAAIFSGRGTPKKDVDTRVQVRVRDFAPAFIEHSRLISGNKHSALVSKEQILRDHLLPFFGDTCVRDVLTPKVQDYIKDRLLCGLKPKTVNNTLTVLRSMLDLAATRGLIPGIPKIDWLRVAKPEFDFLDYHQHEDQRVILGADPEWRPMVALAVYTGMRQGELLALRWSAVDLPKARLRVLAAVWRGVEGSPKGGQAREAPLVSAAVHALLARKAEMNGEYVFHHEGKRLTDGQCKWPLWAACDVGKIGRRVGWHVLRHTFASTLVMRGVPLSVVQGLMGHQDISQTQRYAHLSPTSRSDGAGALEGISPDAESALRAALEPQVPDSSSNSL